MISYSFSTNFVNKYALNLISCICFLITPVFTIFSQSQNTEEGKYKILADAQSTLGNKQYLKAYTILLENQGIFQNDSSPINSMYYQILSKYCSFVGDINNANLFHKKALNNQVVNLNTQEHHFINDASCKNAANFLSANSSKYDALLLNEAHYLPEHRVFLMLLLQNFYNSGYKYLALEALFRRDTSLTYRKYPVFNKTGYYINEPMFGNLVREAIKIGFELVPYDYSDSKCYDDTLKPEYCLNLRDLHQAKNINEIFVKNKNSKVIVYAGYSHIDKKTNDDWIKMAEYLQIISNKKLLVVDQVHTKNTELDSIQRYKCNESEPYVIINKEDKSFLMTKYREFYDIQVVYPQYRFSFGRPAYLEWLKDYSWFSLDQYKKKISVGSLIQAFHIEEKEDPVPADQFIVIDPLLNYALRLPKGKYRLKIFDPSDVLKEEQVINVE